MLNLINIDNTYMAYATRKYYRNYFISFVYSMYCKVQNANNAITFKILSDDQLHATTSSISAGDTHTSTITSNCCSPSYSSL